MTPEELKSALAKDLSRKKSELLLVGPMLTEAHLFEHFFPHKTILAIDGGVTFLTSLRGKIPFFSLGDQDSTTEPLDLILPKEKDLSDFAVALELIKDVALKRVTLIGFSSGRLDHELIVMGELLKWLTRLHTPVECYHSDSQGSYLNWEAFHAKISKVHHGLFSYMSLQKTQVSIEGEVRYSAKELAYTPFSSQTLSNFSSGKITVLSSAPFILYYPREKKC